MKIHQSQILLIFLLSFIVGIFIANWWMPGEIICYGLILIFVSLAFILKKKIFWVAVFLGLTGLALGLWRISLTQNDFEIDDLAYFNGRDIELTGFLAQEPDVRGDHQRIVVETSQIKLDDKFYEVSGKVLIKTNLYPEYFYGNNLKVIGRLQAPPEVDGFDYEKYLSRYDIYSVIYSPRIYLNDGFDGSFLKSKILQFKNKIAGIINFGLPEPQASILSAMLLGNRRGIPQDLLDKFSQTGTSHMIAISGMHIGIISAILMSLLIGLGLRRQIAFVTATIFLVLFIIMVGAPASAVRAGMMGFMALLAMNLGRLNKSINALLLVAGIMLITNPKLLLSDIGFQLSFMAVLGLIYILPFFEKWFEKIPEALGIKSAVEMTLSAQVTTLPLILFYFGKLSLIAPLVNVIVVPILPFILIGGILASLVSLIFITLAKFIFLPIWLLISYVVKIVELTSQIPGAYFEIDNFSILLLTVSYLVVGYWILYGNFLKKKLET